MSNAYCEHENRGNIQIITRESIIGRHPANRNEHHSRRSRSV